jgi:hypothetical protein
MFTEIRVRCRDGQTTDPSLSVTKITRLEPRNLLHFNQLELDHSVSNGRKFLPSEAGHTSRLHGH